MKLVNVSNNFFVVIVVSLHKNSGVGLTEFDLPPQDGHEVLVRHFDDLDELREDGMAVDGNHLLKVSNKKKCVFSGYSFKSTSLIEASENDS